jgi:hypothetical protein
MYHPEPPSHQLSRQARPHTANNIHQTLASSGNKQRTQNRNFGYDPPPSIDLSSDDRKTRREKIFSERYTAIHERYQALDQQLDAERYHYMKLKKREKEIQSLISQEMCDAENYAKTWKDPEKANKAAYATSQRILSLIRRLKDESLPRVSTPRKADVLESSRVVGIASRPGSGRYAPRRGYQPPPEVEKQVMEQLQRQQRRQSP